MKTGDLPQVPVCSALDDREIAQIVGVITALAAMTSSTPSLIIGKLTGTLWTIKEASDLLNAAKLYEPLNDRIIQDLVRNSIPQEAGEACQQACSDVVVRETFAGEMMKRGLATGHGDTLADLHAQLWWQFDEILCRQPHPDKRHERSE